MNWGVNGILIIFGAFVLLLILNPRLSCFGKRITSPLYPVLHKKKAQTAKGEDYGFDLTEVGSETDSGNDKQETGT